MTNVETVSLEVRGPVGILLIDNPPVNAISVTVRKGVLDALRVAESVDDIRAIAIVCAGRTFLSGADMTEFDSGIAEPDYQALMSALEACSKPVVAVMHGTVLGGGLEVALACHYRICVPDTKLGMPEITLGVLPGAGGTQRLPRLMGALPALDFMLAGAPVDAVRALDLGLVDKVVQGDPASMGFEFAQELVARGGKPRPTSARSVDSAGFDEEGIQKVLASHARALTGRTTQTAFIKAVKAAVALPFEDGLKVEGDLANETVAGAESRALRHAFFAERSASKIPNLASTVRSLTIRKVAVIGAGTMGSGIATAFNNAGFEVLLIDASEQGLQRGLGLIKKTYDDGARRGRMSQEEATEKFGRIEGALDLARVKDADLVVEAVFEDMTLKKKVLSDIDKLAKPEAILASNTSSLSVSELAAATSRPDKVVGLHFFSPAHIMRLLEIVRAGETSDETLVTALQIAGAIRKVGVISGDGFGFIGNRMMLDGYFREAEQLILEGAPPSQVDAVMQRFGFAMGPSQVNDMGGVDIGAQVREQLFLRESRADPYCIVSDTLTKHGRLGQKVGKGFYDYSENPRKGEPDDEVVKIIADLAAERGIKQRTILDSEIEERCVLQLINVGADILADGIAFRASDIDVVWLLGYGFPRHLGGPMFYADELGLPHVLERVRHYEATVQSYWTPSPLLIKLAGNNGSFAGYDEQKTSGQD
tara:strand:+ start:24298 stop:26424 length:2127 start_codon:yes stop_codon:yes gene_type:complete